MKILVIIPAYNEEANITAVIAGVRQSSLSPDIVVVNDASRDRTSELARAAGAHVLDLPINLGIGGAVQTGYRYAWEHDYDVAVQMDGDGQHDPAFLPLLVKPLADDQADLVVGSRFIGCQGFQSSFFRRMGIGLIRLLLQGLTGQVFTDPTSGFRACRRSVIRLFAHYYPVDYPEPESLVTVRREHYRSLEVSVVMKERQAGQSSLSGFIGPYYMLKVCLAVLVERLKKNHLPPDSREALAGKPTC